jgi:hypothetical protein
MKDLNSFHIDYFTATKDFTKTNNMKLNKDIGKYYWSKLKKYFRNGNIILVRDFTHGFDTLIQLAEDPRDMTESEIVEAKDYGRQKCIGFYKIIYRDVEMSSNKKRVIKQQLKKEILEKYDNQCQGILCPKCAYKCQNRFDIGEYKPEFDHVIGFSTDGGLTNIDNLVPLCKGCHAMKTALFNRELINRLDKVKYSPNVVVVK